jgi:hypothetical protein
MEALKEIGASLAGTAAMMVIVMPYILGVYDKWIHALCDGILRKWGAN